MLVILISRKMMSAAFIAGMIVIVACTALRSPSFLPRESALKDESDEGGCGEKKRDIRLLPESWQLQNDGLLIATEGSKDYSWNTLIRDRLRNEDCAGEENHSGIQDRLKGNGSSNMNIAAREVELFDIYNVQYHIGDHPSVSEVLALYERTRP